MHKTENDIWFIIIRVLYSIFELIVWSHLMQVQVFKTPLFLKQKCGFCRSAVIADSGIAFTCRTPLCLLKNGMWGGKLPPVGKALGTDLWKLPVVPHLQLCQWAQGDC